MDTSHPFTVGLRRVLKEPRERAEGAGSEGRGGRKSPPGKSVWTFPPPSAGSVRAEEGHRLLLRGEGGRSPAQVRRPYQLEWPWRARARSALTCRRLSTGSAPRHRGARSHTRAACPPSLTAEGYCYPSPRWGQAGGSSVLVRRRPLCPDARLSVRGGAGTGALQISCWTWSLSGCRGNPRSGSASWRDEPRSGCPAGWRRVALLLLPWVLLNDEVSFHQNKAINCLDSGASGRQQGWSQRLGMPQLVRQKCLVGIYRMATSSRLRARSCGVRW